VLTFPTIRAILLSNPNDEGGKIMVKNNIELDVKVKCLEANMTQQQVGETIGTTGQYVNRIIKKKDGIINKTFVEMLEALGYDIELTYVPREK
jgi:predicted XRE-type DNA-binding protein